MADNTTLNTGTGGDVIGSDDISGVKYQRVKLILGADGVNDGDVESGNPLPVDVASLPALPAGNNNIGDVDIASIAAGDNNIGNVDIVTMPDGDIDVVGQWSFQAYIEIGGLKGYGSIFTQQIQKPIL